MSDPTMLKRLREHGLRGYVRGYDEKTDEFLFATEDDLVEEVRLTLDRANPRRSDIHKSLMDILAGRSVLREGIKLKVGEMPEKMVSPNRGDPPVNVNDGKLQLIDADDLELSPAARKIVRDGVVIGEWGKEQERAVDNFADTLVMEHAHDVIYQLATDDDTFREKVLPRALEIARRELKVPATDKTFGDEALNRFAPRTVHGALSGAEKTHTSNAVEQVAYDTGQKLRAQSAGFNEAEREWKASKGKASREVSEAMLSCAMNYASQRAIVEYIAEQAAGSKDIPPILKRAEDMLIEDGQLLYGHPKRTTEDFARASSEAARQLSPQVLAGVMAWQAGATIEKPTIKGQKEEDLKFHKEVLADVEAAGESKTPAVGNQRLRIYLAGACHRLDRYNTREREQVYVEQCKTVAPDKRPQLRSEPLPTAKKPIDHLKLSESIEMFGKGGANLIQDGHKFAAGVEGIGSM